MLASNFSVQRERPSGAAPQAVAINRASCWPSSTRGFVRQGGLRSSAASKPSWTNRSRNRCTVERLTSNASAICSSHHAGPSASAFKSIRARSTLALAVRTCESRISQPNRSDIDSRTTDLASLPMTHSLKGSSIHQGQCLAEMIKPVKTKWINH